MIPFSCCILVPVFNDWESLPILLKEIDTVFSKQSLQVKIVAVDDGSTEYDDDYLAGITLSAISSVNHLRLKRNLGHQKAITIGLAYLQEHCKDISAVVIMDSDGEDSPQDIPALMEKCIALNNKKIVFAERSKRSEALLFRTFYGLYKKVFKFLIGKDITFGNFSIIPVNILDRIVVVSEIWNNYAAGVVKSRLPFATVPTVRQKRNKGESKMNFESLILHGLSAISVHVDIIGARSLLATSYITAFSLLMMIVVLLVRLAIPNWMPYVAGLSFIILLQSMTIILSFVFIILSSRNNFEFLPQRDYAHFVLSFTEVYGEGGNGEEVV